MWVDTVVEFQNLQVLDYKETIETNITIRG